MYSFTRWRTTVAEMKSSTISQLLTYTARHTTTQPTSSVSVQYGEKNRIWIDYVDNDKPNILFIS